MGSLLAYSISSGIILCILYLCYKWVLSGERQHNLNRVVLWMIYVVSLTAFPLSVWFASVMLTPSPVPVMESFEIDGVLRGGIVDVVPDGAALPTVLLWIYLGGIAFVVVTTLATVLNLWRIIAVGERKKMGMYVLVITDRIDVAPFSWGRYVVMPRVDWQSYGEMILCHETRHLCLRHWIDLLFAQGVIALQWFNPAAWLMREELKAVHEYQADFAVLNSGVKVRDYQMLLIKKAVGARFPSLANSLNHSKLKKRITMMYNQKSCASRQMRGLALVPALGLALAVCHLDAFASALTSLSTAKFEISLDNKALPVNGNEIGVPANGPAAHFDDGVQQSSVGKVSENQSSRQEVSEADTKVEAKIPEKAITRNADKDVIIDTPDVLAKFPGGDSELVKYVYSNVCYPKNAFENGVHGRVVVQFVVRADGSVGDVNIVRKVDPELDAEAIRVVKSLPDFEPAINGGTPVASIYTLPIVFNLMDDKKGNDSKDKNGGVSDVCKTVAASDIDREIDAGKVVLYVDGKPSTARFKDIVPSTIQSMTVKESADGNTTSIYIVLKPGK